MVKQSKEGRRSDTWLYVAASTAGAGLLFMILVSWSTSTRIMIGIAGIGLALISLSQWRKKSRYVSTRDVTIDTASILIDAESRAEIVFGPTVTIVDPKLIMSAHGRPVIVEDTWRNGLSLLSLPRAVHCWRHGIVYRGILDSQHTLRIMLHNQGFTPAMVHAKIVVESKDPKEQ